jgi:hypothetical protein
VTFSIQEEIVESYSAFMGMNTNNLAGCGKTLIRAGFGKGTTSVVPTSHGKWLAL